MQLRFHFPKNIDFNFENFVLDNKNSEVVALCRAFSLRSKGQPASLALYGPPGCGKTHLLGAMGDYVKKIPGNDKALYLDAIALKKWVSQTGSYDELKERLREFEEASFVAIDNLDSLIGDEAAQEQVFHLYNAVTQNGSALATALVTAPAGWNFIPELKTRLLWGQALELKPVGDDKRALVLVKMAKDLAMTLPGNCASWIITRTARDTSSQLEALRKIDRLSLTTRRKVSIQLIKEALGVEDGI
ncbi:hypothetical protein MNBD_NITROSPINAE02-1039 [hydrothermal vent metagenome]|uniref:AAA+ ATPase domain-containing protein n=1 Tax=hydrothermal vent metagenome TaxID=652676 RepID=A0A3B1BM34_9ZZZZ